MPEACVPWCDLHGATPLVKVNLNSLEWRIHIYLFLLMADIISFIGYNVRYKGRTNTRHLGKKENAVASASYCGNVISIPPFSQ